MNNKTKMFLQVLAVFGLAIAINFVGYLNKKLNSIGERIGILINFRLYNGQEVEEISLSILDTRPKKMDCGQEI